APPPRRRDQACLSDGESNGNAEANPGDGTATPWLPCKVSRHPRPRRLLRRERTVGSAAAVDAGGAGARAQRGERRVRVARRLTGVVVARGAGRVRIAIGEQSRALALDDAAAAGAGYG